MTVIMQLLLDASSFVLDMLGWTEIASNRPLVVGLQDAERESEDRRVLLSPIYNI